MRSCQTSSVRPVVRSSRPSTNLPIMKLHEPPTLPCPFCDKLFETDHKRKKHIKSIHVEDDQKLYQCNICNKGFPFFPSYESHMNSHKNIRPYSCHLCDNAYQNHFNLQQHVKK